MLLKEKGYDEFLAEKIRIAREQFANGQYVTKEELNVRMKALFAELEKEQQQEQMLHNRVIYG
ncbi:hypothetical protein A1D29_08225 [Pasteurellaceae bacterium Orientalotternb1]|nr:hypothetical protein A1D29_08225 [Pasteurellaceae bacterium Orientalotternb1]